MRWLCSIAALLSAQIADADTVDIEVTDPPRSFVSARGGDPVSIVATVHYHLTSSEGGQIAFAVQDQDSKPLATVPLSAVPVKRRRDVVVFKTSVKTLGPRVKRVVLVAALITEVPVSPRIRRPASVIDTRLSHKTLSRSLTQPREPQTVRPPQGPPASSSLPDPRQPATSPDPTDQREPLTVAASSSAPPISRTRC